MPITLNWSKAKSISLTQQLRDVPLATWNCVQGLQGHHHQYLGIPQEPNLLDAPVPGLVEDISQWSAVQKGINNYLGIRMVIPIA